MALLKHVVFHKVIRLYTQNHFKEEYTSGFCKFLGHNYFLQIIVPMALFIQSMTAHVYLFITYNYFLAHAYACTCRLHMWICIICLHVTHVQRDCDMRGPFNLWVICNVAVFVWNYYIRIAMVQIIYKLNGSRVSHVCHTHVTCKRNLQICTCTLHTRVHGSNHVC